MKSLYHKLFFHGLRAQWMDSRITFPFNIVTFPPYCFTFLSIPCKFYHLFRPTSVSCQLQLHQDKPGKSMANFENFMKKKLAGKFDAPGEKGDFLS